MLKMVNAGEVQLDTLNQLSEAGVPIFSGLAEHFGTSIKNVRSMVTEGKVGLEYMSHAHNNLSGRPGATRVMIMITDFVMKVAPIGVFGLVASVAAATHLKENGVDFEAVAHEEYESLYLRDPDGHLIELYYWPEW